LSNINLCFGLLKLCGTQSMVVGVRQYLTSGNSVAFLY
jgi:hypothetical protein